MAAELVGTRWTVEVGPVAHGGHCVARHEGRVLFVRHALPGETVVAEVTEDAGRFLRADAVEVVLPSPDRVEPPCPYAGPGRCGGCDWQHVAPEAQLRLKVAVVREQLDRLAHLPDFPVAGRALPGGALGWRTRLRYATVGDGSLGLRRHRSHVLVPVDHCPLGTPEATGAVAVGPEPGGAWPAGNEVAVATSATGETAVLVRPASARDGGRWRSVRGPDVLTERCGERELRVAPTGFWQVHAAAPAVLTEAVAAALRPGPGDRVLDLYAGVGLFAADLAPRVATGDGTAAVTAVEGDRRAAALARANLAELGVRVIQGSVASALGHRGRAPRTADLVVLDPPRAGAGAEVVAAVAERGPRRIAYVSCDPATLARDVATFGSHGYGLVSAEVLDLFPMSRHVETLAVLTPA